MFIIVFFTYGISLKTWDETGLLDREIQIYKRMTKKGVKISFITYGDESDYKYKDKLSDIDIIPFYAFVKKPKNSFIRFIQSLFLPLILRDFLQKADIIKTNQMSTTFAPLIAKFLFKKNLIVRCGFEWYYFLIKGGASLITKIRMFITEYFFYHLADAIVLTSNFDKNFVVKNFKVKSNKITIIPNFIDANVYLPYNSKNKKESLLFIGRLTNQKNLFNLIDALKNSNYSLDIVGDGELKSQLMTYASQHNVNVNFLGRIPNSQIPALMNQYEVFILPSYYEGNPKALLEAMSCGLAVIGTDVEGIRDIIKHKENGYLCKTDSKSIRDAIDEIMHDKNLREVMGKNARKYVMENHDIEKITDLELQIYQRLIC